MWDFFAVPWLLQSKFKGCKGEQPIKKKSKSEYFSKIFTCLISATYSYKPKENP